MSTPSMCPHCGFNLAADQSLVSGPWKLEPTLIYLNGERVSVTAGQASALYTIARAQGKPVKVEVIGSRGGMAEFPEILGRTLICKARKKVPSIPVETVWGQGYRWIGDLPQAEVA